MSDIIDQVLQSNIYIQPIHFILAIITNILNIRVLCCRVLRSSPCTHYLLAYAIISIIYTCMMCPTLFLRGFSIYWAHGKIGCKIHFYLAFLIPYQANLMLIFASFDRYRSSLRLRRLRSKRLIQTARLVIVFGIVSCTIFMLPTLMIYNWDANSQKCLPQSSLLINIYTFGQFGFYYIVIPLLMIIFGFLSIANIRRQSSRANLRITFRRGRRTEGQLTRMLLLQVGVHVIISIPFGITYSINLFVPSTETPQMIAIRLAFVTWQQCNYFISFFLYVLTASVYREQLIRIFQCSKRSNLLKNTYVQKSKSVYGNIVLVELQMKHMNELRNNN